MGVTINVNGLSLVHKGSGGITSATLPDVCKTPMPGGPVPIPYPNVAYSADLVKGTTTVNADGGHMIANHGSELSKSTGDEPGSVGGVSSGVHLKEATWMTYSFDVQFEGKGACRLSDKMFHNHGNTVNASGHVNPPLPTDKLIEIICEHFCKIVEEGKTKNGKYTNELMDRLKKDSRLANQGLNLEKRFLVRNVTGKTAEAMGRKAVKEAAYKKLKAMAVKKLVTLPAKAIPVVGWLSAAYDVYEVVMIIPDIVQLVDGGIKHIIEVKFPGDRWGPGQEQLYNELGNGQVDKIDDTRCGCKKTKTS